MTAKKRVLIVSATTGYQLRAFNEAAERLGVELTFATDRCHMLDDPWRDAAVPVRFYDEADALEALAEAAGDEPFAGILAVGDRPTVLAALAAERWGLPGNPSAAARASANKQLTREAIASAGLPAPWFFTVPAGCPPMAAAAAARFPCVVKPLAMAGSRGVMRADDERQFADAFGWLQGLLARPQVKAERNPAHETILVEGYIPGREFALEGLLDRGTLRPLALFDKPDPLDGPFFEETIYVTPPRLSQAEQESIVHTIAAAARGIGLKHGPIHAECRVNERGVYVLEVAARPIGGLCAKALQFVVAPEPKANAIEDRERAEGWGPASTEPASTENDDVISLEELLLRHAIGERIDGYVREARASAVMMIPIPRRGQLKGLDGLDEAGAIEGIEEIAITAKTDQMLQPLPEGASYLGFIFARAASGEAAIAAVREAHARLSFRIEKPIAVVAAWPEPQR
ncbi:MAG: ATP-grasp domain-containing protein [Vicinamibacterales bacterium]